MLGRLLMLSFLSLGAAAFGNTEPHTLEVTLTAYASTVAQTDGSPRVTATGEPVRPGIVAVSRDLLDTQLPYGTRVRVKSIQTEREGCGGYPTSTIFEVQDTMAADIVNQVDIWMPTHQEAVNWGSCVATLAVVSYE